MEAPLIEVQHLRKEYGRVVAVDDVSFAIRAREFLTLLGPSGCGKTTILRMIAGLEIPTRGAIYLKGRQVFSSDKGICVPARERAVGLVFQSYALWPHMTVFENIAFGLQVKRAGKPAIARQVDDMLAYMQLDGLQARYPQEMSGGQQQRVALARMLVNKPEILLMDEPLSNLDAKLRLEMRAELKNIHAQTGATTVYVTHDQLEGQTMASQIAVINKGRIEQMAPPKTIYRRPANLFVADFIGFPTINLIEGRTARRGAARGVCFGQPASFLATAYPHLPDDRAVVAGIRPENIRLAAHDGPNTLAGEVRTILPSGPETVLRVRHGAQTFSLLATQEVDLAPGAAVFMVLPPENILVFEQASGRLLAPEEG